MFLMWLNGRKNDWLLVMLLMNRDDRAVTTKEKCDEK